LHTSALQSHRQSDTNRSHKNTHHELGLDMLLIWKKIGYTIFRIVNLMWDGEGGLAKASSCYFFYNCILCKWIMPSMSMFASLLYIALSWHLFLHLAFNATASHLHGAWSYIAHAPLLFLHHKFCCFPLGLFLHHFVILCFDTFMKSMFSCFINSFIWFVQVFVFFCFGFACFKFSWCFLCLMCYAGAICLNFTLHLLFRCVFSFPSFHL
jgi:hypothetical protein